MDKYIVDEKTKELRISEYKDLFYKDFMNLLYEIGEKKGFKKEDLDKAKDGLETRLRINAESIINKIESESDTSDDFKTFDSFSVFYLYDKHLSPELKNFLLPISYLDSTHFSKKSTDEYDSAGTDWTKTEIKELANFGEFIKHSFLDSKDVGSFDKYYKDIKSMLINFKKQYEDKGLIKKPEYFLINAFKSYFDVLNKIYYDEKLDKAASIKKPNVMPKEMYAELYKRISEIN